MSTTTKRPLCGECEDGFIVDPKTLLPVRRCECRYRELTAEQARAAGVAATSGANPDAMRAALAIIRETALASETFSANDCRLRMEIAQVPGQVIGAAFGQAIRDRLIRRDGYEPSTQASTHSHEIKRYRSLIWRPGRRTA